MLSEVTEEMRQSCRLCSRSSRWKREDEWAPFMYLIRLLCIECHVPGKELGIPSKFPWNCKIAVRSSRRGRGQGGHGEKFSSKFLHSVFWIQPLFFSWLWSSQSRESHMSLTVSSRGAMSFLSAINYHRKVIRLCHPFLLAKLSVGFLLPAV